VEKVIGAPAFDVLIDRVCDGGATPPVDCENESELGEAVSEFDEMMFRVTGNDCGLLVTLPEVAVIVTLPVYVPTPRPAGFAAIDTLIGVIPLVGLTSSQLEPELVVEVTVKLSGVPSVEVTATFWNEDATEPTVAENEAVFGLTTSNAVLLTTSATCMVWGTLLAPGVATEIVPLYVPAASPVALTLTTIFPGASPLEGDTLSQDWPAGTWAVAVKFT